MVSLNGIFKIKTLHTSILPGVSRIRRAVLGIESVVNTNSGLPRTFTTSENLTSISITSPAEW